MTSAIMKAWQYAKYGGPDVLSLANVAVPTVAAGQVLVKVKAFSFNPIDFKRRGGAMKMLVTEPFPITIGYDGSGVIEAVGDESSTFKVGDEVVVCITGKTHGTAAEFTLADTDITSLKPKEVSFETAAALPLAGMTALQMLRKGKIQSGHSVFVAVGAGGVGHFAIQLAKLFGASRITTTASGAKMEMCKTLGATEVIDYRVTKLSTLEPAQYDVVLDMAGECSDLIRLCKPGGWVVSATEGLTSESFAEVGMSPGFIVRTFLWFKNRSIFSLASSAKVNLFGIFLRPNAKDLDELLQYCVSGKLVSITTDNVFEGIEKGAEALKKLESGRVAGKVVITI